MLKVSGGLSCPNTFNQEGEHMDFKKLFRKDDKAVSPVIGVILMVAITVILAAAIGSSVFSKGAVESAPQANLEIKSSRLDTNNTACVKIEHLGGDPINFDRSITKVMTTVGTGNSTEVYFGAITTSADFEVGDVQIVELRMPPTSGTDNTGTAITVNSGDSVNIKVIDIATSQLICDKNLRF
ncbi:type IV pilin [Methanosarcina barkeri]|uniref:type IV pilin n=1 Tax=Methanosarcina barkeri TaxID=2208 RepID=UPI001E48A2D7|nr:type IV pilin [Methanosarcina barkeri]